MLFNVVVYNIIRTCLDMTTEDQRVVQEILVETVGRCVGVLYADNCMVRFCNSGWLQHAMDVLVGLFRRYGLADNIAKSRTMTCHTSAFRAGMSEESMALKRTGVGHLYQVGL